MMRLPFRDVASFRSAEQGTLGAIVYCVGVAGLSVAAAVAQVKIVQTPPADAAAARAVTAPSRGGEVRECSAQTSAAIGSCNRAARPVGP